MRLLQINHVHHHEHDPQIERRLRAVEYKLDLILRKLETIMINTEALVAAAQRVTKGNADLLAVFIIVRDLSVANAAALAVVRAELAAIPANTAAAEAAIAAVEANLTKVAEDTEAAVAANKQVPDMPPAEPPPVV